MEVIEVTGSAFERGCQHGKAFADKARACCEYYRVVGGLDVQDPSTARRLDLIERNVERLAPSLLDEVRGISAGSGVPYREVLLLNSSTEFGAIEPLVRGCTNMIMADAPHGILHGYNYDHKPGAVMRFSAGEVAALGNGRHVSCSTWPGTIWTIAGVNNAGLTQGMSGVWTVDSNWDEGIPSHMLARLPLQQCSSVPEAVALVSQLCPIATSYNLVFSDVHGDAAIVEKSPTGQAVRHLEGRALFCANTFVTDQMQDKLNVRNEHLLTNARHRLQNLERLTGDKQSTWDMARLLEILRYHSKDGGSICMHGEPGDLAGFQSIHSYLMIPVDRRILATDGIPCQFPHLPLRTWLP